MHTGGGDRLWNWPFSQLTDFSVLDFNLGSGQMAYRHSYRSSTSVLNFTDIGKTFCGWMDTVAGYIKSTRKWPKQVRLPVCAVQISRVLSETLCQHRASLDQETGPSILTRETQKSSCQRQKWLLLILLFSIAIFDLLWKASWMKTLQFLRLVTKTWNDKCYVVVLWTTTECQIL